MYQATKDKSDKVLELYRQGLKVQDIVRITGSSKKTIKKILVLKTGINYTEERIKKKQWAYEQVPVMYNAGVAKRVIAEKLELTHKTVEDILNDLGIESKSHSQQMMIRHGNTINEKIFDIITPQSAYWIGMLYTDGHVVKKGLGNSVSLTLHTNDRESVERFKKFLEYSGNIKKSKDVNRCTLTFGCERIYNRLKELGFDNQKSYTAKVHPELQDSKDFWRGCIDGDGCLWCGWTNRGLRYILHLCGTYDTCFKFAEFIRNNGIDIKSSVRNHGSETLFQIAFEGSTAKKVAKLLYEGAEDYMERKYKVYQQSFNQ